MTGVQTCGLPISRRVRLSREKGWRMPENTVKLDRTSKWGNPHKGTRTEAAAAYARDIQDLHSAGSLGLHMLDELRRDLRGKNLACWCPLDGPCHADVLLRVANASLSRGGEADFGLKR